MAPTRAETRRVATLLLLCVTATLCVTTVVAVNATNSTGTPTPFVQLGRSNTPGVQVKPLTSTTPTPAPATPAPATPEPPTPVPESTTTTDSGSQTQSEMVDYYETDEYGRVISVRCTPDQLVPQLPCVLRSSWYPADTLASPHRHWPFSHQWENVAAVLRRYVNPVAPYGTAPWVVEHFLHVANGTSAVNDDTDVVLAVVALDVYLLQFGGDPNAVVCINGEPNLGLLFLAARFGFAAVVARLLQHHRTVVDMRSGTYRNTPLHAATAGGHQSVVALLLARCADASIVNAGGLTPLDIAERHSHAECTAMLSRDDDDSTTHQFSFGDVEDEFSALVLGLSFGDPFQCRVRDHCVIRLEYRCRVCMGHGTNAPVTCHNFAQLFAHLVACPLLLGTMDVTEANRLQNFAVLNRQLCLVVAHATDVLCQRPLPTLVQIQCWVDLAPFGVSLGGEKDCEVGEMS